MTKSIYENPDLIADLEKENIQIGVLGSSYLLYGIRTGFFTAKAYNFAANSQDLYYSRKMYEKFGSRLPLRYIVVGVSRYAFGFDVSKNERRMIFQYSNLGISPRDSSAEKWEAGKKRTSAHSRPAQPFNLSYFLQRHLEKSMLYRNRTVFLIRLYTRLFPASTPSQKSENASPKPQHFPLQMLRMKLKPVTAAGHAQKHLSAFDQNLRPYAKHDLDALIDQALSQGIRVLIVSPPMREDYQSALTAELKDSFQVDIKDVLSVYRDNPSVRFLDLFSDKRFLPEDFGDPDHLNPQGAEKLTKILNAEIEKTR